MSHDKHILLELCHFLQWYHCLFFQCSREFGFVVSSAGDWSLDLCTYPMSIMVNFKLNKSVYSCDPNTGRDKIQIKRKRLKFGIWIVGLINWLRWHKKLPNLDAIQIPDTCWSGIWLICTFAVQFLSNILKTELLRMLFSAPFKIKTITSFNQRAFFHLNTGQAWYLDPFVLYFIFIIAIILLD